MIPRPLQEITRRQPYQAGAVFFYAWETLLEQSRNNFMGNYTVEFFRNSFWKNQEHHPQKSGMTIPKNTGWPSL